MDESDHEDRLRRLQRIAYGAVASDTERTAAVAELEALRRERWAEPEPDLAVPVPLAPPRTAPITDAAAVARDAGAEASARRFRWAIAAGTAALLVGVVVGWQVGTRVPAAAPEAADQALGGAMSVPVGPGAAVSVPVAGSAAYAAFDRPATATDTLPVEIPDDWVDPASVRLLATTPDGLAVFGAKALDRSTPDVCVIIVRPNGSAGASCTVKGVFEEGRLRADHYMQGEGLAWAAWHADGSVQVGSRQVTLPAG